MALSENDRHDDFLRRKQLPALDAGSFGAILRRRGRLIGLVTLGCGLAGLAYAMLSVPRYMASGRIFIDRPAAELAAQPAAFTAPALLDRVIAREKLDSDPLFGGRPRTTLSLLLSGLGLASSADPQALALRQLTRTVSARSGTDPSFIDVQALTSDRATSMRVANAVMDAYIEDQSGTQSSAPLPVDGVQPASLQARLKESEQRYEKFRSETGSNIAERVSATEKQVSALTERLAAAETKAENLRSATRNRRTDADPESVRGGRVDALRGRYAAAKRLQDELSETLGPRHPDMVIAKLQVGEAKRALDQAVRERIEDRTESVAAEQDRARSAVSDLKSRLESAKKDLVKVKDTSARLRELERDVEINRTAYQAAATKSPDAAAPLRSNAQVTRIVSRAVLPSDSVGTSRMMILLLSILLGLLAGAALALLLELRPQWPWKTEA